ncbi:MAG: carboxypeptidase regulatory-like domain-containing protein, partial [Gemmatimonadales bacterium]
MTAKFGLNLGRLAKAFAAVMALSVGSTALAAQETAGKIEGTVRDPNGQPVAGAQVFIVGSSFATQTNNSGYYFLNNVPSGTYTVRAQFIGMQPAEVQNVRVRGGQTLTVGFDLQGAVALEAISVTVAETPIVPRDQVSSRSIVSGGDVDDLPVNDPTSIVTLQPGVVVGRGGAISIRGGRRNEAAVFIDGAPVRSGTTGSTNLNIATNSLEEVAVTTGALGAEFGDAQSGVISFVTRAGGPNFAGSLTYETDEFFGSQARGRNRFEGSLSGPLFGTLTFFVGGTVTGATSADLRPGADEVPIYRFGGVDTTVTVARSGADSARVAVPMFVQVGGECDDGFQAGSANRTLRNQDAAGNTIECQGVRRPGSWNTQARVSGKLQLTYGSGSRMSVSAHLDRDQSLGSGFNLESSAGSRSESGIYVLNWVQQVFRGVSSELAFDINLSYQTDQVITGLVEREWDLDHRDPSLSIVIDPVPFVFDLDHFSDETGPNAVTSLNTKQDWERLILNVRTNLGTRVPLLDRNDLRPNPQPRRNPYACINCGFSIEGLPGTFMRIREETRLIGRGNIDWQAGRFNRLKFGGEYRSA